MTDALGRSPSPPTSRLGASAFEYRHRYLIHGLIYTLGFAAPWHLPVWGFVRNASTWFLIANGASKPLYQHFATYWNAVLIVMLAFAVAGAWLRTWGAAYLGASTVQRGSMVGDQVIAAGPFRYLRNPLYLGTLLNTVAISLLMRPEAAVLTVLLILLVQFRLIFREEPYLLAERGETYALYRRQVPRLLPALHPAPAQQAARPDWRSGILSEVYVIGTAVTLAVAGWSTGFEWENTVLHVMQGLLVSLGLSVVARAFIPKAQF